MTAVEWYAEQAMKLEIERLHGKISIGQMLNQLSTVLKQSKEMEKYQIMSAHSDGIDSGYQYAKNDNIYIESENFLNTCNSTKYYNLVYNTENNKATD